MESVETTELIESGGFHRITRKLQTSRQRGLLLRWTIFQSGSSHHRPGSPPADGIRRGQWALIAWVFWTLIHIVSNPNQLLMMRIAPNFPPFLYFGNNINQPSTTLLTSHLIHFFETGVAAWSLRPAQKLEEASRLLSSVLRPLFWMLDDPDGTQRRCFSGLVEAASLPHHISLQNIPTYFNIKYTHYKQPEAGVLRSTGWYIRCSDYDRGTSTDFFHQYVCCTWENWLMAIQQYVGL